MAGNGARKAPPGSPSSPGLFDKSIVKETLKEIDGEKKQLILKIKKPAPKATLPGNWKETDTINVSKEAKEAKEAKESKDSDTPKDAASPIVNKVDKKIATAFPNGRPVGDTVDTVQCKHCRRPVLRSVAATHIRDCLNKKQEKLKKKKEAKEAKDAALRKDKGLDDDDGPGKNARKSAIKGSVDGEGAKKGKKRKIDADSSEKGPLKKKKKDEPKAKTAKPKGPVDVERQCGVALPNNGFCARSLTCKSHSMGLKRAVPGRSLPYDMLLAQYQKKNQAKQQRAAIDANAPLPEDLEPSGAVDSDEEKDAIMSALSRHRPRPLATFTPISQKSKYQYIRMKDMLRSAFGGPPQSSMFGTTPGVDNLSTRNLGMGMMGAPGSATADSFPNGGFATPLSAGLDGPGPGSRRQSSISVAGGSAGPRQILPGQLPGPGPQQRKGSMASVASVGAS